MYFLLNEISMNIYHLQELQTEFFGYFLVQGRDVYVMVSFLMGTLEVYLLSAEYLVLSSEFNTSQNLNFFYLSLLLECVVSCELL